MFSSCLRALAGSLRAGLIGLAGVALVAAVDAPSALAAPPPGSEVITTTWHAVSSSSTPPYRLTGSGTYAADGVIADSGDVSVVGQDPAVASPVVGVAQGDRIFTSPAGSLVVRCTQTSHDFADLTAIPGSGACAIVGGSGVYAGAHGAGTITTLSNVIALVETDTLSLRLS